jgi:hypothetical protein
LNDYRKSASPPGIAVIANEDSFALSPLLRTGQLSGVIAGKLDTVRYRTLTGGGIPPQRIGGVADGGLLSLGVMAGLTELAWLRKRRRRAAAIEAVQRDPANSAGTFAA